MSRQRRMLWASVSTSRKVNRLSDRAAILWTWAIPYFDDEGYMEGDPETLKARVVPLRDNISKKDVLKLRQEIIDRGLWVLFKVPGRSGDEEFIQDPVFKIKQPVRGAKYPSEIKELIKNSGKVTLQECQKCSVTELKGTELKGTELKGTIYTPVESNCLYKEKVNPELFASLYNENCPNLVKSVRLSEDRRRRINARLKEFEDIEWWIEVFKKANEVYIEANENHPEWKPDLEFIVRNSDNAVKIFEGKYSRKKSKGKLLESADLFMKMTGGYEDEPKRQEEVSGLLIEDKGGSPRPKS